MSAGLAISVDVWDTLLRLDRYYACLAESISQVTGFSSRDVLNALQSARAKVKHLRVAGSIDVKRIVDQCLSLLAVELATTPEALKRGIAKSTLDIRREGLVYEDAVEALKQLHNEGIPVVAVSNVMWWPGFVTRIVVEKAGIGYLLAAQLYADEVEALKPDPLVFQKASEALKMAGSTVELKIHVGDDFREDFLGAMSAGLKGVLVDRRGEWEEGVYFKGKGCVIKDMRKILDLLT
ncbi:MAG: HAD family hydrolase [Thermofilaceae archaeon]|nr:HAD family hydrolase [Thermofilaceae archaeon]MCX8180142.1 HAD family hydrolase [Thermofilaceae archaeon]MDW8004202.1 HAD family hydrolase [Thermofilaceae archaeon]